MSSGQKIQQLELDLEEHINKLQAKFLAPFLPANPSHKPSHYEHDVKAFCILAHAAFEEFIEEVSMLVMTDAIETWKTKRVATDPIISLCLYYGLSITAIEKEDSPQKLCFDLLREAIDEGKTCHSNAIHGNHGFSLKYLRSALTPVFINVPNDVVRLASLQTLAAARGSFAHSSARNAEYSSRPTKRNRDKAIAPEEAKNIVKDCLDLCKDISNDTKKLFPAPAQTPNPTKSPNDINFLRKRIIERRKKTLRAKNGANCCCQTFQPFPRRSKSLIPV